MNRPIPHVSRASLQMVSGAAGLIAIFAAISLPLLALPGAAASRSLPLLASRTTITVMVLTIALAAVASMLLRFSLSHEYKLRSSHISPSHNHPHSA
jgi:hypothetical protein